MTRKPARRNTDRVLDAMIGQWLEQTPAGRAMLASLSKADAIAQIRKLQADGLIRVVVDDHTRPGHLGIRIEIAPAPEGN